MKTATEIRNAGWAGAAALCFSLLAPAAQAADVLTVTGIMQVQLDGVLFGQAGVGAPYAAAPGYGTFQDLLTGSGIFAGDSGSAATTCKIQSLDEPAGPVALASAFMTFDTGTIILQAWATKIVAAPGGGVISVVDTPSGGKLGFEVDGFILDTNSHTQVDDFAMNFTAQIAGETKAQLLQNLPAATTFSAVLVTTPISAAPEPAAWAMMLTGFAAIGALLRRRRGKRAAFA